MKTKEQCTAFLLFAIAVSAIGGFLFGYHMAIITGALSFLVPAFQLSIADQAMVVSIILMGALIGALSGGSIADRIGRKRAMIVTAVFFIFGALICSLCQSYAMLLIGRLVSGFGLGMSSVAGPIYLAEISPPHYRGAFVACYQLAVTLGILSSFLVSYLFATSADWRWMFAMGMFPAIFQLIALFFFTETPAWLFKRGLPEQGIHVLKRLRKDREWVHQVEAMKHAASNRRKGMWKILFSPALRYVLIVGVCLSVMQQITGINTVIFYAPKIFQTVGIASDTGAILATLGIGLINVIATLFSMWLLDRAGRRILLLVGTVGMAVCLGMLSTAYFTQAKMIDLVAFISLIGYVAFFAIGLGPVTWVVLSEIYPLKVRGHAMTMAIFGNWLFNYLVALTFLNLIEILKPEGTFLMYAIICVFSAWFVYRFIPETKGKSLEEIESMLIPK
jgi:SP family galactose:H+ symporter-like MFS transporter